MGFKLDRCQGQSSAQRLCVQNQHVNNAHKHLIIGTFPAIKDSN